MICAWPELMAIIPQKYRQSVENEGRGGLQEIRMRKDMPLELICINGVHWIKERSTEADLLFCIQYASQFSPWASDTISKGFITAPGGHRVGISGEISQSEQKVITIKNPTSLCIRVANEVRNVANTIQNMEGSILIMGKPGSGKTTMLRSLINRRSEINQEHIVVIDERREIFPIAEGKFVFLPGKRVDVISGASKAWGTESGIKVMNPDVIAVDEITSEEDCAAILSAANCGVRIIASAHGESMKDFQRRKVYKALYRHQVFNSILCLKNDKSFTEETLEYDE